MPARMGRASFDTMKLSTQLLVPVLVAVAACGGSGTATTGQDGIDPGSQALVTPADAEILSMVYDNEYSVPNGFYVDERAETVRSYTVHHVLDASNSYELCSDDLVEAQALEAEDNRSRAVNGYYVTSYENERYFEFVRELSYTSDVGNIADITSPGYGRVFKCGHTNRNGVDRTLLDGYAGKLSTEHLNGAALRIFTEYLWQFTFINVASKKVVASYASANGLAPGHTLLLALLTRQGDGACDRVDVIEWRFTANKDSGQITREFETLRSFGASLSNGIPAFCQ